MFTAFDLTVETFARVAAILAGEVVARRVGFALVRTA